MPITYGYEAPLARRGVNIGYGAGFNEGLANARRFSAELQQGYDQMTNQRWMQQQDHLASLRNMQVQGAMNSQLQQAGQQGRMDMARLQSQLGMDEQQQYMELRNRYDQEIMQAELDHQATAERNAMERKRGHLKQALESGALNEDQYRLMDQRILEQALNSEIPMRVKKPGSPESFYMDPRTKNLMWVGPDGTPQIMAPSLPPMQELLNDGSFLAWDAEGNKIDTVDDLGRAAMTVTYDRDGKPRVTEVQGRAGQKSGDYQSLDIESRIKLESEWMNEATARYKAELDALKDWMAIKSSPSPGGEAPDIGPRPEVHDADWHFQRLYQQWNERQGATGGMDATPSSLPQPAAVAPTGTITPIKRSVWGSTGAAFSAPARIDPGVSWQGALQQLSDQAGTPIEANWRALKMVGIEPTDILPPMAASGEVRDVMKYLSEQANGEITWSMSNGKIALTIPNAEEKLRYRPDTGFDPQSGPKPPVEYLREQAREQMGETLWEQQQTDLAIQRFQEAKTPAEREEAYEQLPPHIKQRLNEMQYVGNYIEDLGAPN